MSRPQTNTVDYFPHDCNSKSTLRILKSKWGNDGYAFWFQLLEQLGLNENHFIDLNQPGKIEDLSAITGCDETTVTEMLGLLAKLQTINPELWESRIIWCQNFVDRISDVYKNRKREIPQKPVSTPKSTQSKVKESKAKESKKNHSSALLENPEYGRLTNLLFQKIADRNPNHKTPDFKKWCRNIKLMIDNDKRQPDEIESVIKWCQQDEFWQNNILSTQKLRKHFDQLILKMRNNGNKLNITQKSILESEAQDREYQHHQNINHQKSIV